MRPSCTTCHGKGCPNCGNLTCQARDWLQAKCPPSIAHQGGHNAAFKAACVLVKGFDLTPAAAFPLLAEWNTACSPPWSDRELQHKLHSANNSPDTEPRGYLIWRTSTTQSTGPQHKSPASPLHPSLSSFIPPKKLPFNLDALKSEQLPNLFVDEAWLAERSPIHPTTVTPSQFLTTLYQPGERILIFTRQFSQGDYGVRIDPGPQARWSQLHPHSGPPAKPIPPPFDDLTAPTPRTLTPEGAWYLAQPVDGRWHLDPGSRDPRTGLPRHSRRSQLAVTTWRYLVLESDDAPTHLWLNLLVQLPIPLAALYTSGGRSVHALLRIDAPSKAAFDNARQLLLPLLSLLGADPAAITAVRLTRLPGIHRHGKSTKDHRFQPFPKPLLQRLLYLNPTPKNSPILTQPIHRHHAPA